MNGRIHPLRAAEAYASSHRNELLNFLHQLRALNQRFLLRSSIQDTFAQVCSEDETATLCTSPIATVVDWCQEAAMDDAWICFALRLRVARWMYVRIHPETLDMETISVSDFLAFKERLATGGPDNQW
ncbi:MAG: hypothetical protein WBM52_03380, partial [Thiogranum sp.]